MERMLGFKLGIVLIIIGFLYLTQTGLKGLLPIPAIDDYIDGFTMPVEVGGVNIVLIMWFVMIGGIAAFVLAAADLPPFNY